MKNFKIISIFALTLLFIFTLSNTVYAVGELRIHNRTRYDIVRVYVSPYGRNHYSRQQNSRYIPGGKNFRLGNMPISRGKRYWNIKIVLSNGKSYEWKKSDLYSKRDMTIYYKGSSLHSNWD